MTEVDAPHLRLAVPADASTGLTHDSFLMIDKVTTVRRSNVQSTIGRLDATAMVELERRLLVFLGFG